MNWKLFFSGLRAGFWSSKAGVSTGFRRTLRMLGPGTLREQGKELAYIHSLVDAKHKISPELGVGFGIGHYGGMALGMLGSSVGLGVVGGWVGGGIGGLVGGPRGAMAGRRFGSFVGHVYPLYQGVGAGFRGIGTTEEELGKYLGKVNQKLSDSNAVLPNSSHAASPASNPRPTSPPPASNPPPTTPPPASNPPPTTPPPASNPPPRVPTSRRSRANSSGNNQRGRGRRRRNQVDDSHASNPTLDTSSNQPPTVVPPATPIAVPDANSGASPIGSQLDMEAERAARLEQIMDIFGSIDKYREARIKAAINDAEEDASTQGKKLSEARKREIIEMTNKQVDEYIK